ncbi:retrovirus-related pol polyprotein from transposon TNT 1-94 [Tanacetum coccineum]
MRLLAGIHQTSVGKKLAILFGIISTRLRESKISQRSKDFEKGRGNGMHVNQRRTATSVSSGLSSFTFTSKQFENLMRNVLNDMNPSATISDCTDNELEFDLGIRKVQGLGGKIRGMFHLLNFPMDQVDAKLRIKVEYNVNSSLFSCSAGVYNKTMCPIMYLMVYKSDDLEVIKDFLEFVELQFETKVKRIRSDNTLEFVKGPCALFLASHGIEHQTTCVDRPQQNGRVKRNDKHILEVARALSSSSFIQPLHVPMPTPPAMYNDYEPMTVQNVQVLQEETVVPNTPNVPSLSHPTSATTTSIENQVGKSTSTLMTHQDPKGFTEAIKELGWCDAVNAELGALVENGTWELADLPPDKKVIGSH